MNLLIALVLASVLLSSQVYCATETVYKPQFEYEFRVLQTLVDLGETDDEIKDALNNGKERIAKLTAMLEDSVKQIGYLNDTVNILRSQSMESGATYIRWGRTTCAGDAEVVYDGYTAGSYYSHGGGTNYLCLPKDPKWGTYDDRKSGIGLLYGVEYELGGSHQNHDAPCVVCKIPRSNVFMIPGTNVCQSGWKREYWGYLVSQAYTHTGKDFVCLDKDPEYLTTGSSDRNGGLFYYVEGRCGSLKCPPYVDGRELTCAVCSYGKHY